MKFSYCSIRSRDSICIALQLQLPLLNLLLFIAPDYIIHTVADTVFPTLCLKQLIQLCGMWRITAVNIMIALFIQSAFSREIMIQLIVVIIPLIIPQSHAKCREEWASSKSPHRYRPCAIPPMPESVHLSLGHTVQSSFPEHHPHR